MSPVEDARYRRFVCVLVSILVHVSAGAFFYGTSGLDSRAQTSARDGPNASEVERFAITVDRRVEPIAPEPIRPLEIPEPEPEPRVEPDASPRAARTPEAPEPVKPTDPDWQPPAIGDLPACPGLIAWRPELAAAQDRAAKRLSQLSERLSQALRRAHAEAARIASAPRPNEPQADKTPGSTPPETPERTQVEEPTSDSGRVGGATGPARPEAAIRPRYPRGSIRRGETGTVIVQADVSVAGKVTAAKVVSSSGHRRLDAAALRAVREATFRPARRRGQPVADTVRVPIHFRLDR